MYKIRLKKQAVKEFATLQENIRNKEKELDIKLLTPKKDKRFRLRVWKYRIVYKNDHNVLIIYVLKIWTRWDIYK